MLALAAALLLGISPGLTPAQARARLAELSPVAIVDRSQTDRPRYSLRFDSSNLRSLAPVGTGRVVDGHRVWRAFRFDGQAYDEVTAGRYRFSLTFLAGSVSGKISGFRGGAGYEKTGAQVAPTVPRVSLEAWRQAAAAMVASGARNEFVISFNEWGESSAIESATEWASPSGFGAYLDVLREVLPPLPGG